ncbi:unnamed protein product [Rotaria sordida]|uniref:Uncharacterized protein n=2 Tax=Rotaria sordida TaxID=392033 RepID=A0A814N1T1_9BILA|nr:unnamed protein product [Rotaria sordida]CAF1087369.1 unnamed protein product [Rotaria sordida]CAF1255289.1 unnamed protein product [Rotaria sordida]
MLIDSKYLPFCVRCRTEKILSSQIRYFDVIILIPNLIFLLFIIIKWILTRTKININKPLLLSVTCLLLLITLSNILRCLFVMIFPDNVFNAQEIIVKVFWLCIRFTLLWTELSVLLFGICFGRSNSNRPSIKTLKVLVISFIFTSIYITIQAILEFRRNTRPIKFQTSDYHLYSYGGMRFLLISSSIFLSMYIIIFFLPCLCLRHKRYLPIRRSFYFYCFVLALINMIQIIGTILNLTETTIYSMCIIDGISSTFYICFAPFVYFQFLRRALRLNVLIPRIMYADTTINDGEDDDLIDPGVNILIDNSTNDRLDGQFEDITSSTRIIQPII